jgi:hypothetical protein
MKEIVVRHVLVVLIATFCLSTAVARASEQALIDCPLRNAPFSVDGPLIDLLLSDDAKRTLDREMPAFLQQLPPMFTSATVPSFASILTLRQLATFRGNSMKRGTRRVPL